MELLVLCPSRGRPTDALLTKQSFETTASTGKSDLMFIVDQDDPAIAQYNREVTTIEVPPLGNMVAALNMGAAIAIEMFQPKYLGFVGDDHRFRSQAWDLYVIDALEKMGGGIVYGDDLAQRWRLPTQVFMNSSIVSELGWMALPTCHHLYVDNAWMVLGQAMKRFKYVPEAVIEHLHPAYGKGVWDEGHVRVNTDKMYAHDKEAFEHWLHGGNFEADLDRALGAL